MDGLGFVMTFEDDAIPAIKAGKLEVVLDEWCPPFPGPFLYYPSRRHPPPALAALFQFVPEHGTPEHGTRAAPRMQWVR
jgi:DNA-binding transcriptional LysR family regulator